MFLCPNFDDLLRNKYEQVWSACRSNADESEQHIHEMDVLAGHENDVNYVQFRFVNFCLLIHFFSWFFC